MPNTTSASLKLTVQATGENSGTWGQITNTNLLILEQAIGGYDAVALNATTGATLVYTDGALSNGKNKVIKLTGTQTAEDRKHGSAEVRRLLLEGFQTLSLLHYGTAFCGVWKL